MARKKVEPAVAVAPIEAKPSKPSKAPESAKAKPSSDAPKKAKADKAPVATAKKESKPRQKREAVSDEAVMKALRGGPMSKKEIVAACGGDDIATTVALSRCRASGKVVVTGTTRNSVYKAA